jgi:hypothetical protein
MAGDAMVCPRAHRSSRIVRDGIQRMGGRQKQRWRCISPDGSYHRFLGVVSRTRATSETCTECENHIAPHEGPAAPAEFEYLIREVAASLVEVGRGMTYSEAAQRVRMRANIGKTNGWKAVASGQTVAEWMADFVPIVGARYAPKEWPPVIVLDSVSFKWTDQLTSKTHQLYSIFAAYGYDENGKNGRLVKVEASPSGDTAAWAEFLVSLPGRPVSIVADEDKAIRGGINAVWGAEAFEGMVHQCEYHLGANAMAAMRSDKLKQSDEIWRLFMPALSSRTDWDVFEAAVCAQPALRFINMWVSRQAEMLQRQTSLREGRPPVYANGAVEQSLSRIREIVQPRQYAYRNRARTNRMLELVRLSMVRADDAAEYATAIREYLDRHNGRMPRTYRAIYDKTAAGLSSLWSVATQVAMKEARDQKAVARKVARVASELANRPVEAKVKPDGYKPIW